jgi:hypothetical protein
MLLDSLSGLHGLHPSLLQFLKSDETTASFATQISGDPALYDESLARLRIEIFRDSALAHY